MLRAEQIWDEIPFLSTPSARRATCGAAHESCLHGFLSTPSARRATVFGKKFYRTLPYFYPRPPRGGRRASGCDHHDCSGFLSTPSARRATSAVRLRMVVLVISIHALREEGDARISPPRSFGGHFYPRPPRGGRHNFKEVFALSIQISIHALREEGDRDSSTIINSLIKFLSTPSARRAT